MARAINGEAGRTFVLVLAITSTAVAAAVSRPGSGGPCGSLAVPVAGGLALAIGVARRRPYLWCPLHPCGDARIFSGATRCATRRSK
jgi:hypothetical protein